MTSTRSIVNALGRAVNGEEPRPVTDNEMLITVWTRIIMAIVSIALILGVLIAIAGFRHDAMARFAIEHGAWWCAVTEDGKIDKCGPSTPKAEAKK